MRKVSIRNFVYKPMKPNFHLEKFTGKREIKGKQGIILLPCHNPNPVQSFEM